MLLMKVVALLAESVVGQNVINEKSKKQKKLRTFGAFFVSGINLITTPLRFLFPYHLEEYLICLRSHLLSSELQPRYL